MQTTDAVTHRAAVLLLVVAPLALHAVGVGAAGALVARHRLGHDPLDHGTRGRGHRLQAHLALDGGGVDGDAPDGRGRAGLASWLGRILEPRSISPLYPSLSWRWHSPWAPFRCSPRLFE